MAEGGFTCGILWRLHGVLPDFLRIPVFPSAAFPNCLCRSGAHDGWDDWFRDGYILRRHDVGFIEAELLQHTFRTSQGINGQCSPVPGISGFTWDGKGTRIILPGMPAWEGKFNALLTGAIINRLMERVPSNDRPAHMAWHNLALNLGILIGSFLGPVSAGLIGLQPALFLGAGLRLLAAGFFWLWG